MANPPDLRELPEDRERGVDKNWRHTWMETPLLNTETYWQETVGKQQGDGNQEDTTREDAASHQRDDYEVAGKHLGYRLDSWGNSHQERGT